MTTRDKSITERQFSLDRAFSSLSSELCHKMMTTSFPSYDFKTPEIFTTSPKIDSTTFIYNPGPIKSSSRRQIIQHLNIPLLSHLQNHNTGFLRPQCLVHYLEGLGVEDGSQVLEDLGLSADEERLDLRIVSQKLNDEIGQALEIVSYASVQAAIATLYDEVGIAKNALDNAIKERDKLRADVQEAQKRAAVLAMEMDEQNYLHDKIKQEELQDLRQTWVEGLKYLEEKLKSERETHETEIQGLKRTIDEEKTSYENIHRRIEKELSTEIKKNKKLEDELKSKNAMMAELEEMNPAKKVWTRLKSGLFGWKTLARPTISPSGETAKTVSVIQHSQMNKISKIRQYSPPKLIFGGEGTENEIFNKTMKIFKQRDRVLAEKSSTDMLDTGGHSGVNRKCGSLES